MRSGVWRAEQQAYLCAHEAQQACLHGASLAGGRSHEVTQGGGAQLLHDERAGLVQAAPVAAHDVGVDATRQDERLLRGRMAHGARA